MKKLFFSLILGLGIISMPFKAKALTPEIKNKTIVVLAGSPFYAAAGAILYIIIKAKLEKPEPKKTWLNLDSLRNLENILLVPAGLITFIGYAISYSTYEALNANITK